MKKCIFQLSFLLLSVCTFAQNYAPFHAQVSKRFHEVTDPTADDYFFYADTAITNGSLSTFFQYYTSRDSFFSLEENYCPAWGGYAKVVDTTWLGEKLVYDAANGQLTCVNKWQDSLTYNFAIGLGDSALFYTDGNDRYYIKHIGTSFENIFNAQDSLKTFTVYHYDVAGNMVASPLQGFEIKLAKSLGLVSFMNTWKFPEIETGVAIKGQIYPLIGNYHMSYEELYPYQVGDILQYKGVYTSPSGAYSNTFTTFTVISRTETTDSITFSFSESEFMYGYNPVPMTNLPSYPFNLPNPLTIPKNRDFIDSPYNREVLLPGHYTQNSEVENNFCPTDKYSIVKGGDFLSYCDTLRAFHQVDGFGSSIPINHYVKGLGHTNSYDLNYGPLWPPTTDTYRAFLVYSNIGGEECGTRSYADIEENGSTNISIFPNPASDFIHINLVFERCDIYGMEGKLLMSSINDNTQGVDISSLSAGTYYVKFLSEGKYYYSKFVKL